ncbi:putative membrane protein [Anaerosolibacter carboniphilus]|uniref:Putative membrane protein n=1 Tax=Anaerosolibacter carboniphilus TaxID=1417629 RepID=A0A841KNK9_9FIRM|nr:hypothetical protein [Anaerosolibacter carboniphilus]MBB6214993.1 putative membrane protein [Anaerosolibacter carboniphilus]
MQNRRTILYMLLIVIGVIFIYNFIFAPMFFQQNWQMGMGMGMHSKMRMYNNYNYSMNFWIIIFVAIAIGGFILLDMLQAQNSAKKCRRCGFDVESERWKICPMCGAHINRKG